MSWKGTKAFKQKNSKYTGLLTPLKTLLFMTEILIILENTELEYPSYEIIGKRLDCPGSSLGLVDTTFAVMHIRDPIRWVAALFSRRLG
jgi:hypothetical protein